MFVVCRFVMVFGLFFSVSSSYGTALDAQEDVSYKKITTEYVHLPNLRIQALEKDLSSKMYRNRLANCMGYKDTNDLNERLESCSQELGVKESELQRLVDANKFNLVSKLHIAPAYTTYYQEDNSTIRTPFSVKGGRSIKLNAVAPYGTDIYALAKIFMVFNVLQRLI